MQTGWDFCLGESKQGFGSVGELSGAVYRGDQGGLLLITCLLTAIKPSLHSRTHKSPYECSTLYLIFIFSFCFWPKAFCQGPGRTDEDILDAVRGRRLHPSAFSGSVKSGNRFLPPRVLVSSGSEREQGEGGGRRREGREGKGEQDLFLSSWVTVNLALSCCGLMAVG